MIDRYKKEGFKVDLTQETRDGGIDIVQRIYAVKTDLQVNKGIIVTTSNFTKKAREFELRHFSEVELKDYKQIIQWMKYVYTKEVTI